MAYTVRDNSEGPVVKSKWKVQEEKDRKYQKQYGNKGNMEKGVDSAEDQGSYKFYTKMVKSDKEWQDIEKKKK